MACNSCAKSFSALLRKEKGCPSCGFSYCSGCLNNKVFVPKLNKEAKVCAKCKKNLSSTSENDNKNIIVPPDAYYKRLAAAGISSENIDKSSEVNTIDDEIKNRLNKLKADKIKSENPTDEDIAKRLQNIKGETSTATDAEIYARLARLRGVPEIATESKPVLPVKDLRTEQEQVEDLMKQYLDQTKIDTKYKDEFDSVIDSIQSRVQKLKDGNVPGGSSGKEELVRKKSESDEEETVMKIVEKIKAEATLDDDIDHSTNDELPFCEICNEDARMRCLGCKYLFCKRCFLEHKDDDDDCNQYEPYSPPKQK